LIYTFNKTSCSIFHWAQAAPSRYRDEIYWTHYTSLVSCVCIAVPAGGGDRDVVTLWRERDRSRTTPGHRRRYGHPRTVDGSNLQRRIPTQAALC